MPPPFWERFLDRFLGLLIGVAVVCAYLVPAAILVLLIKWIFT